MASHPLGWLPPKKEKKNAQCWRGHGEPGIPMYYWWECKMVEPLWKTGGQLVKRLKIELLYDPAVPLLDISPKDVKTGTQVWVHPCRAALSPIAKKWKQPKQPSTNKWVNKMWYVHTMEYYSALKRKEILTHATTGMTFEDIILNEISQSQKGKPIAISLTRGVYNS